MRRKSRWNSSIACEARTRPPRKNSSGSSPLAHTLRSKPLLLHGMQERIRYWPAARSRGTCLSGLRLSRVTPGPRVPRWRHCRPPSESVWVCWPELQFGTILAVPAECRAALLLHVAGAALWTPRRPCGASGCTIPRPGRPFETRRPAFSGEFAAPEPPSGVLFTPRRRPRSVIVRKAHST